MKAERIELFGSVLEFGADRVATNTVRLLFTGLQDAQRQRIATGFETLFADFDGLYERADAVANEVRELAVEQAMQVLASASIYEVSEQEFFQRFMSPYDSWDQDFQPIADAYEAMVEHSAELDRYRTARRRDRAKWVGFNEKAVYHADAKNAISNVGHGVFNLMAKGVTAIGNAIKKDEIFKSPQTATRVREGIVDIVGAAYSGILDALNELKPGSVHVYSEDEVARTTAIIENVRKDRVPQSDLLPTLLRAVESYPYARDAYVLLLQQIGGDHSRLDEAVAFFGVTPLAPEKRRLFQSKRDALSASGLDALTSQSPAFRAYASEIGMPEDEADAALSQLLMAARKREFLLEVTKHPLSTPEDLDRNLPVLEAYARTIGFEGFDGWAADVRQKGVSGTRNISDKALAKSTLSDACIATTEGKTARQKPEPKIKDMVVGFAFIALLIFGGYKAYSHFISTSDAEVEAITNETVAQVLTASAPVPAEAPSTAAFPSAEASAAAPAASEVDSEAKAAASAPEGARLRPLSLAAEQAVREEFVDIKDPAVQACTDAKVDAFHKANGEDALVNYAIYNEFAVACGFNI